MLWKYCGVPLIYSKEAISLLQISSFESYLDLLAAQQLLHSGTVIPQQSLLSFLLHPSLSSLKHEYIYLELDPN